jgi:hypothetical protein
MGVKLGMYGKLYRNAGTYAAPDWEEITNVKDLTLSLEKGEADATTRANNGWKATLPTLKEATIEFEMVWDTEDEGFSALQEAFFGDTSVEVAIMDGDMETEGAQGLRCTVGVPKFDRSEPLAEAMSVKVTLKPTYAVHAPEWITAAGGGVRLSFDVALAAGAGSLDLTAIPYGEGTYDATGKKVVEVRISNAGANALTVSKAVANGYDLFANDDDIVVPAGGSVKLAGTGGANIDGTHKALTLVGTGSQASAWTLVLA